ncbi:MAG TPA: AIR synthase-related protein [Planktothrix sp.]|jgi:phosphoribosylformylglycinamidine synthase
MSQHAPQAELTGELFASGAKELCLAVVPRRNVVVFPLYWVKFTGDVEQEKLLAALTEILTDPLQEELWHATSDEREIWMQRWTRESFRWWGERQFLPGVTDNLAHTVEEALRLKGFAAKVKVASGTGYLFSDADGANASEFARGKKQGGRLFATQDELEEFARYNFFHPITDRFAVHDLLQERADKKRWLRFPTVHLPQPQAPQVINLDMDDDKLEALSKKRLLALSKAEMRAIQQHFKAPATKQARAKEGLPEWPTDVELEIIAQTWSEHCKHKIFNANITHTDYAMSAAKQKQNIKSLYKTFIQAPTRAMMKTRPELLSVFEDNSGVVRWNDDWAVCFKVETHNSPSALEPYGGALTGILGVNRDVLGTGLGARPIFNTDVFCFAYPTPELAVRPKLLPPKTILDGVRKGVEDGGNKSGIPTVNGAIFFDPGYRAKPLVFCGTGGVLPTDIDGVCGYKKHTKVGDAVVMAGGRVGKDGIHGATFSSESLHEGSPVSAVQIGDPFTQKRLLDFIIEARDLGMITGITDNGAGGLSSSVGEMANITGGASIELETVPTKYPGLNDWEIVVSESQERMTLSTRQFAKLKQLADKHSVEVAHIGKFDDSKHFTVTRNGKKVAWLQLSFLHDGCPVLELESEWRPSQITMNTGPVPPDLKKSLIRLLSHPNISSREQIIRQYDHEVQGQSVIKQLMGRGQKAPCDAAVVLPVFGEQSGLVISNGIAPRLSNHDCYLMAVCAVDEAIRNAVCVGADPATITLLDNFCWPDPVHSASNPRGKIILAQLVRACHGLYDAVNAYGTPLISGKDSMKNDFDDGVLRLSIPPTLLISAIGRVHDIDSCISMEFKQAGDSIYLLSAGVAGVAGSHYEEMVGWQSPMVPLIDKKKAALLYQQLHRAINSKFVRSAHDLSEGGLAVALSECAIGGDLGAHVRLDKLMALTEKNAKTYPAPANSQKLLYRIDSVLFGEAPARIVVTVSPKQKREFERLMAEVDCTEIGAVTEDTRLLVEQTQSEQAQPLAHLDVAVKELERAWTTQLPFD